MYGIDRWIQWPLIKNYRDRSIPQLPQAVRMREETAALLADVAHNLRHVLGTLHTHDQYICT